MIHDTKRAQISQKQDEHNIYVNILHIYIYILHIYIYIYIYICMYVKNMTVFSPQVIFWRLLNLGRANELTKSVQSINLKCS